MCCEERCRRVVRLQIMPSRAMLAAATITATAIGAYVLYLRRRRPAPDADAACATGTCSTTSGAGADGKISRARKKAASSPCVTVIPPTLSRAWMIEYSVHRPSRLLRNDILLVFRPDLTAAFKADPRGEAAGMDFAAYIAAYLLAIPTWQPSKYDLSEISFPVNEERASLLRNFDEWATLVRPALGARWSDCSCPMEGTARYGTPTSAIYNELEGLTTLLRYDAIPIGCCGIVLHPQWKRRAYPVTLFTLAPLEVVVSSLEAAERTRAAAAR